MAGFANYSTTIVLLAGLAYLPASSQWRTGGTARLYEPYVRLPTNLTLALIEWRLWRWMDVDWRYELVWWGWVGGSLRGAGGWRLELWLVAG
jgi:hypothetical protein